MYAKHNQQQEPQQKHKQLLKKVLQQSPFGKNKNMDNSTNQSKIDRKINNNKKTFKTTITTTIQNHHKKKNSNN